MQIDGETVETVSDFIFLGSKITADGDCRHEIKRCLLLGRKVMINQDSILKSRDITLPTKIHLVKAMVFPVVMYGCESWTVKKAKCRRIDAFDLWCWRRLLRVPWTARRSNQFILKEISPGCSLEGLMLKLKFQCFGHLMQRADAFELWCWRRLLRVPWTARRSIQSSLKEISPGISLEGMMLKLKLQYFGHLMRRVDSLEDFDAGRDWGQEEKGTTEDEIAGWHH